MVDADGDAQDLERIAGGFNVNAPDAGGARVVTLTGNSSLTRSLAPPGFGF